MRKLRFTGRSQPRTSGDGAAPQGGGGGFGAALAALVDRKTRELKGRWGAASARARRSEATRRAVREMAKRIAKETGRKPLADSTIRRYASKDVVPKGVDRERVTRQARIDQAGGITAMAARTGQPVSRVRRWRQRGAMITEGGALRVSPVVDGWLIRGESRYEKKTSAMRFGSPMLMRTRFGSLTPSTIRTRSKR